VALRRLAVSDLAAFQAYRADADLNRYQEWSVSPDQEASEFLREMSEAALLRPGHWVQIGIADREDLALLGDIGLFLADDSRHLEIGFTLARRVHGRGLATMAVREAIQLVFQRTAVERVLAITDARNHASIGVLERVGMRKQEERTTVFRGEPCLEYVYAIERDGG
jgi:[ribosomal protein S5]-alanine N-acetyltransferase